MDIKRVPPERTDVITHVGGAGPVRGAAPAERPRPQRKAPAKRRRDDDLVFGAFSKSTIGFISLGALFVIALIFGVKELEMTLLVYIVVLVICTAMGFLLANFPGFVPILISALLLIVGAITKLLPAVALGVAMLIGTSLVIRGE